MKRKMEKKIEQRKEIRRSGFLALTVIFFCFMAGITYYSIGYYQRSLPSVTVIEFSSMEMDGKTYDTAVPRGALYPEEGEMAYHLFSVRKKEGPWGQSCYVTQNRVLCPDEWYGREELEKVPVVCMDTVEGPVILEHEGELYTGEEIRIVNKSEGKS